MLDASVHESCSLAADAFPSPSTVRGRGAKTGGFPEACRGLRQWLPLLNSGTAAARTRSTHCAAAACHRWSDLRGRRAVGADADKPMDGTDNEGSPQGNNVKSGRKYSETPQWIKISRRRTHHDAAIQAKRTIKAAWAARSSPLLQESPQTRELGKRKGKRFVVRGRVDKNGGNAAARSGGATICPMPTRNAERLSGSDRMIDPLS